MDLAFPEISKPEQCKIQGDAALGYRPMLAQGRPLGGNSMLSKQMALPLPRPAEGQGACLGSEPPSDGGRASL